MKYPPLPPEASPAVTEVCATFADERTTQPIQLSSIEIQRPTCCVLFLPLAGRALVCHREYFGSAIQPASEVFLDRRRRVSAAPRRARVSPLLL